MGLCASAQERGPSPLQIRTQRAIQQLQAERSAPSSSRTLTKIVLQFPRVKKAFRTVRLVWRRFDADGNGTLDFDELCRCLEAMGAHVTPADAHDMFKEADVDDSKGLDFREFIVALALGCVLQLVPDEEGAGPAPRRAAVPGSDKDVVSRSNPLASASSLKPPTLGERGRSKSYVRTKQMSAVVSAMRICLETFMLFDDNGDGVLQREEVTKQLREKSRNARRHSGVGFGAASFLSQERWDAMAWDRRGQVTFREFCLSFYDWICPDGDTSAMGDEDEEEDDDPMLAVGPHKSTPRAPRGLLPLRESDDGSLCDSDVEDRINITSPVQMLNITACEKCTGRGVNQDSVFCRSGKAVVTVFNESEPEVVVDSATAEAFCWDGTFGALLSPSGEKSWAYEKAVVTWDIQCELGFVLYNQCILSALVAIILMTFGSVVFVALVTALCLCFGLCNCCWVKRKFAMDEDETICCIFAPCDKGDPEARALHENPMAVRQRQKEEAEADDGLMAKI